jgi:type VI secretion system secreted protein Hcp
MAIYMKYSSPDISGGVKTAGFVGQIELSSYSWGVSRQVGSAMAGATNRNASVPIVAELVITKPEDEASGNLFKESLAATGTATAVISLVRTDAGGGKLYLEYTLSNVIISSYSVSGGSDGRPHESLSLNFTKIESKFIPEAVGGDEGDPFPVTYNLETQSTS